jgi:hypothetical protein
VSIQPSVAYHVARLLLLIDAYSVSGAGLAGLTKLAKLDFLLRYPTMLERLLAVRGEQPLGDIGPTAAELTAVETQMIRWKYGPWDDRYYSLIGALISLQLVEVTPGTMLTLRTTILGKEIASELRRHPSWTVTNGRCAILREHFNMSGNSLRNLIYAHLPAVLETPLGAPI